MELSELISEYRDANKMHCMEGSSGVERLCKLLGAIGYEDRLARCGHYGRANLSNLINFLEDNSGAIEAIIEWVAEQNNEEWREAIESELPEKTCDECGGSLKSFMKDTDGTNLEEVFGCPKCDDADNGKCTECGEPLQDDVCQNPDCG